MLSQALAHQVTNSTRARGIRYFESGAVEHVSMQGQVLCATVVGTEPYDVWVEVVAPRLYAGCTCPYFLDRFDICKHMTREQKKDGACRSPKPLRLGINDLRALPDADRGIVERLMGARSLPAYPYTTYADVLRFHLQGRVTEMLPEICETGRALVRVVPPPIVPPASTRRGYRAPPPKPEPPVFIPSPGTMALRGVSSST